MKDTFISPKSITTYNWCVVDAKDMPLGRLATQVSSLLIGKNQAICTPSKNVGSYVIVINADKIKVSGKKVTQKLYFRHSGRPGGKTVESFEKLKLRLPERIIEKAIKGMLPKNRLGRKTFNNLRVYRDVKHPHLAQQIKQEQSHQILKQNLDL
uniref:50S ribosomal protein L13 n=1 Tax=Phaeostrophion irregulare TaxID=243268 RepID=UPI002E784B00|nr:50S ribosomal protein L13 [Phaeostrophion irregulare]WAM64261.1 50S ribosomal protein L13 [Phaeostrophion irregulare]